MPQQFVRGGDTRCAGCSHRRSYIKYWCQKARDYYCDSEERCRVEDEANEASREEQNG